MNNADKLATIIGIIFCFLVFLAAYTLYKKTENPFPETTPHRTKYDFSKPRPTPPSSRMRRPN